MDRTNKYTYIYTLCPKKNGATILMIDYNFANYYPIFKIVSTLEIKLNFERYAYNFIAIILAIRWLHLAKGSSSKFMMKLTL